MVETQMNIPRKIILPTFTGNMKKYVTELTFALNTEIMQLWARAETLDENSNIQDGLIFGDVETTEIRLIPKASSTGAEGTIFYDSDDDHVYVGTE